MNTTIMRIVVGNDVYHIGKTISPNYLSEKRKIIAITTQMGESEGVIWYHVHFDDRSQISIQEKEIDLIEQIPQPQT